MALIDTIPKKRSLSKDSSAHEDAHNADPEKKTKDPTKHNPKLIIKYHLSKGFLLGPTDYFIQRS